MSGRTSSRTATAPGDSGTRRKAWPASSNWPVRPRRCRGGQPRTSASRGPRQCALRPGLRSEARPGGAAALSLGTDERPHLLPRQAGW
jgi:hypothetical protein